MGKPHHPEPESTAVAEVTRPLVTLEDCDRAITMLREHGARRDGNSPYDSRLRKWDRTRALVLEHGVEATPPKTLRRKAKKVPPPLSDEEQTNICETGGLIVRAGGSKYTKLKDGGYR